MKAIDLTEFEPRPLPLKGELERLGIKQVTVSRYLGVSIGALSAWLNGYAPFPARHKRRLETLVNSMDQHE